MDSMDVGDGWEPDVVDAFGEHDIEYWVWNGIRLVPATAAQIACIQEAERERVAALMLSAWTQRQRLPAHRRLLAWVASMWRVRVRLRPSPADADQPAASPTEPLLPEVPQSPHSEAAER